MLQEMGVHVWLPVAAPYAMDSIAVNDDSTRAAGQFDPEPVPAAPPGPSPARAPLGRSAESVQAPQPARDAGLSVRPDGIERMGWATLQATVAACRACGLCQSRKNTVFGLGPTGPSEPVETADAVPSVDWLIVGEAPGENEDMQGEPFVGQAGQLLDNMLRAMKLARGGRAGEAAPAGVSQRVFITNVLKCRPPANRNPQPEEVAQCEPYLKRQVELLRPKLILAMGKFAAQSLLQATVPDVHKTPLGKLRGQVHRYEGVPVVVTYHPAYLLRSLSDKAKAWDDLCQALDEMRRIAPL